jgi:hypothetical protein
LVPEALVHFQEENRLEEHRRHGATSLHLGKYVPSMTPKTLDFRRGTQDKTRVHVCTHPSSHPLAVYVSQHESPGRQSSWHRASSSSELSSTVAPPAPFNKVETASFSSSVKSPRRSS